MKTSVKVTSNKVTTVGAMVLATDYICLYKKKDLVFPRAHVGINPGVMTLIRPRKTNTKMTTVLSML